ncbi:MAG TPA: hypothetical protein VGM30_04805 [Puia sp.]|jgi:hypothetical protein
MSRQEWQNVREEITEIGGREVFKKITREVSGQQASARADFMTWADFGLKIVGLVTVLVTICQYFDSVKDKQKEEVRQHTSDSTSSARWHISDSTSNAHWQAEQIGQQKELDKRIANNFALIVAQNNVEIEKEKREYYLTTLTAASAQMETMLEKPVSSPQFNDASDALIPVLPRIANVGDTAILNVFLAFRDLAQALEAMTAMKKSIDTIRSVIFHSREYIKTNASALLNDFSIGTKDSAFRFYGTRKITRALLDRLDNYSAILMNIVRRREDLLPRPMRNFLEIVSNFEQIAGSHINNLDELIMNRDSLNPIPTPEVLMHKLLTGPRIDQPSSIQFYYEILGIRNQLQKEKNEFDNLIRKKMTFYKNPALKK